MVVGLALGLEGFEFGQGAVELSGEAGFVERQNGNLAEVIFGAVGSGEGDVNLRMVLGGVATVRLIAEEEEVGFEGSQAVEAPGGVGQSLGEVGFGGANG